MKRLLTLILTLSLLLIPFIPAQAAHTSITRDDITVILKTLGIMEGYANGDMGYADTLTRAQFAKISVMSSIYKDTVPEISHTSPFSDVKNTHWAAPYISVAAKNGLMKGYVKGDFRPDQSVLYEEAVTVCLRLLGYKDEELSAGYPYGQLAMADSIDLTDDVGGIRGKPLNRERTARLIYNMLCAKPKTGMQPTYYQSLGYVLTGGVLTAEAVVGDNLTGPVAVTAPGDLNALGLDLGKTFIYKDGKQIAAAAVQIGDVVYYNKKAGIMWVYGERVTGSVTVINTTAQSVISVAVDGKLYALTTSAAQKNIGGVTVGQVVTLTLDRDGGAGYATLTFKGPFVYQPGSGLSALGADLSKATIYRNDKLVTGNDLAAYDLVYFDAAQNTVWAYDKKVSGVLESVQPNRIDPAGVSIGGKNYALSGDRAKQKFGAGGFSAGEMVTLLLDYSGNVFDAYLTKQIYGQTTGVVTEAGVRQFPEADGKTSVSYYATVLTLSGDTMTVRLASSADSYLHKAVRVDLSGSPVNIGGISMSGVPTAGTFHWDTRMLGTSALAKNLYILEIDDYGHYGFVSPDRLDGVKIAQGGTVLAGTNAAGEISHLILRNVTNDFCSFGVVTSVTENRMTDPVTGEPKFSISSAYGYDIAGVPGVLQLPDAIWNVKGGPSMFVFQDKIIVKIQALTQIDAAVTAVNPLYVTANDGKKYKISANVAAYKQLNGVYIATNPDDAAGCKTVRAYYDKPETDGGCVRVLVGY